MSKAKKTETIYVAVVGFINELNFYGPFETKDAGIAWADAHGYQGLPISIQPMKKVIVETLSGTFASLESH